MELRREMNMSIHEARFPFAKIKEIVWHLSGSETTKRKEGREGEKERGKKGRRVGKTEGGG